MTVYLVDLESVESRYTYEWKTYFPEYLRSTGLDVVVIMGPTDIPETTTPGAFLNFGGTNVYKAEQVKQISKLFCDNEIKDGDYFLFADAWHPGIINLKYMIELLGIKAKIGALWHAGSYDPNDFLGRLIGDKPWVRHFEKSLFHVIDDNYFATDTHVQMFGKNLLGWQEELLPDNYRANNIVRTGWPMTYIEKHKSSRSIAKDNLVLFPHRISVEKQPEIFRDLAKSFPDYEFVLCQEKNLKKQEYYDLLARAKMVFSCSLQETLGISVPEGMLAGALALVPDRLSYSEMYDDKSMYPSEWTIDLESYVKNKDELIDLISYKLDNYQSLIDVQSKITDQILSKFFTAGNIVKTIIS
jgi:hypothetical protein